MNLPLPLDLLPVEAETAKEIPRGPEWQYEPKWDGFRCLVFKDGKQISLRSKAGQPLERYFPEMVEALQSLKAEKLIVDGELIVAIERTLQFDDLLQRIHPAASRIQKLSVETPATLMVFDLLADEEARNFADLPLRERRGELMAFAARNFETSARIRLSPATNDFETAREWFSRMAGPLDGVIAKRLDLPYLAGERKAMLKIKNLRTADCVVGGFRYSSKARVVGSLLLGLYDEGGLLHHVGFTSGFAGLDKDVLTKELEGLVAPPGFTGNAPGGPSRWSTERSAEWQPLKPEIVVEVQYDHFSGDRFRHGTKLLRRRPDKPPEQCTLAQVRKDADSPLTLLDK